MFEKITDERKRRWLKRHGFKVMTDEVIAEIMRTNQKDFWRRDAGFIKRNFHLYRRYGTTIEVFSVAPLNEYPLWKHKVSHRQLMRRYVLEQTKFGKVLTWIGILLKYRVIP